MFEWIASLGFAPNFACRFRDQTQLGFLIGFGNQIPFPGGRKAALRAQGEAFERQEPLCLMNSAYFSKPSTASVKCPQKA
jgi:hypothetical protein